MVTYIKNILKIPDMYVCVCCGALNKIKVLPARGRNNKKLKGILKA